jgi:hypothetical protein
VSIAILGGHLKAAAMRFIAQQRADESLPKQLDRLDAHHRSVSVNYLPIVTARLRQDHCMTHADKAMRSVKHFATRYPLGRITTYLLPGESRQYICRIRN